MLTLTRLENGQTDGDKHAFTATPDSQPSVLSPVFLVSSSLAPTNQAIEKDCIDRYFMNLHVIYCFLDKTTFMKRCKQDVWSKGASYPPTDGGRGSTFPALYSAVVAVGALISGDDILDQNSADRQSFWDTLIKQSVAETAHPFKRSSLPRELAKMYFARAKFLLSDFFETCNLETQQTLFLLSIFCQYALKPHCCYMYHGMAARTAMAIGSANLLNIKKRPQEAIRTWWCMYYHEIEVCSLLGRDTMLNDPETYPVFLAKFGDPIPQSIAPDERDENVFFARSNTELARILKQISEVIYHTGSEVEQRPQVNRHQAALDLDNQLLKWKSNLRPVFDLNGTSLTEKETITKRKIILRLRTYNTKFSKVGYWLTRDHRVSQCPNHDPPTVHIGSSVSRQHRNFQHECRNMSECSTANHPADLSNFYESTVLPHLVVQHHVCFQCGFGDPLRFGHRPPWRKHQRASSRR